MRTTRSAVKQEVIQVASPIPSGSSPMERLVEAPNGSKKITINDPQLNTVVVVFWNWKEKKGNTVRP